MLGVASVLLRACSVPKVPASPLVGLWSFDETSPASAVFEDQGEAAVPMTIVGAWADLTTGSLVQGVDGTSAYTNGSTYATIPANQPAHALSALTISFYFQRNSATAKQILLAAGDGSEAGDFSIEVLANGGLRGWHAGQDARLRFFGASGGITGTNLQVGTAYRIDLTLGPQGARLYLDGMELATASIPANTNGWNNARKKYLGRWTDGILSPADGVFDRLRLWNRQLGSADILLLEPAQSIILADPPSQESGLPQSIAEVETLAGAPVTKQVAVDGTGSFTSLKTALDIAVGGDVIAVKGVAGNHKYYETWTLSGRSGTSANPIQVWGWSPDGTQPEITAEHEGGVTWSVHNASKSIYRANISGASYAHGFLPENEGGWQLLMHQTQANFERVETDRLYLGPSMWASSGVVYLRTQHGQRQTVRLVPDGILAQALPVEPNPNNWTGFRFTTKSSYAWTFNNCDHIHFNWLHWFGGQFAIHWQNGSTGLQVKHGDISCSQIGLRMTADGGTASSDCLADRMRFKTRLPRWLTRDDVKGVSRILNQFLNPVVFMRASTKLEVSNCVFEYPFDWMQVFASSNDVNIHHNLVYGAVDDSLQMGPECYNAHFHHNVILGFAGPGHSGGSSSQPSGKHAHVYMHHNIVDCGHAPYELGMINSNTSPFNYGNEKCRASHDSVNNTIFPYRYWNCSFVTRDSVGTGSNVGYVYGDSAPRNSPNEDRGQENWNCILIAPNDSTLLGINGFGEVVTHHPSVANNTPVCMMDGMMFAKASGSIPLFRSLTKMIGGTVRANYASLAAYKAQSGGTHYSASEDAEKYPVSPYRWNGNSTEQDPQLGGNAITSLGAYTLDAQGRFQEPANWSMYVPANTACRDGGVNVAGRWNTSAPDGPYDRNGIESGRTRFYIGAIDPVEDPDGISVGPQNTEIGG